MKKLVTISILAACILTVMPVSYTHLSYCRYCNFNPDYYIQVFSKRQKAEKENKKTY